MKINHRLFGRIIVGGFCLAMGGGIIDISLSAAEPGALTVVQGQPIQGRVVDSNGEPVAGAAIQVEGTLEGKELPGIKAIRE